MKNRLLKALVLSGVVGISSLNCSGGIEETNMIVNPKGETESYEKTWVNHFPTGQSIQYDLDGELDPDGHYSYDVMVGFNSWDKLAEKAKISVKRIHGHYDAGARESY